MSTTDTDIDTSKTTDDTPKTTTATITVERKFENVELRRAAKKRLEREGHKNPTEEEIELLMKHMVIIDHEQAIPQAVQFLRTYARSQMKEDEKYKGVELTDELVDTYLKNETAQHWIGKIKKDKLLGSDVEKEMKEQYEKNRPPKEEIITNEEETPTKKIPIQDFLPETEEIMRVANTFVFTTCARAECRDIVSQVPFPCTECGGRRIYCSAYCQRVDWESHALRCTGETMQARRMILCRDALLKALQETFKKNPTMLIEFQQQLLTHGIPMLFVTARDNYDATNATIDVGQIGFWKNEKDPNYQGLYDCVRGIKNCIVCIIEDSQNPNIRICEYVSIDPNAAARIKAKKDHDSKKEETKTKKVGEETAKQPEAKTKEEVSVITPRTEAPANGGDK
jgi:hypothetical protein